MAILTRYTVMYNQNKSTGNPSKEDSAPTKNKKNIEFLRSIAVGHDRSRYTIKAPGLKLCKSFESLKNMSVKRAYF